MNFPKHVFISYAHIDNATAAGVPRGWVDHLHEHLELRLAQLLGFRPAIWRDKAELQGNRVFRDTIAIGLTETGVFLSVLSPRYLESLSCREELEGFLNAAPRNGGLRLGDRHRIFKIIKTQIDFNQHPEPIRDLLGYEFYAQDAITKRFREYDHEINNGVKDKRYWDKLDDLAQDICQLLREMEGVITPKTGTTIYLAETTSDLAEARDKVRRELVQKQHVILPNAQLPTNKAQLETMVRDCLQRSRLSVHLIGAHYGFVPEDEQERSAVWLQQELARERDDDAEFSRLIWLPEDLEPKDERQRRYIETLERSNHATKDSNLIRSNIEGLKTFIENKLNPPAKPAASEKPDDGLTRLYLVCDKSDLDNIGDLYSYLYDEGCEILLPATDDGALQAHKQNMLDCDGVLFFYGNPQEIWLRTHLRQMTGFGRTQPLKAVGIYVTGEENPQKKLFMSREAVVIKNFGSFDKSILKPFMQQLKGGAR